MAGVGHNSAAKRQDVVGEARAVSVLVLLPTALRRLFPEAPGRLELVAADVRGVIDELDRRWPGMRDRLTDSTPKIRRHLNVFVGEDRARLDTKLTEGCRVTIMTAMSGG
ncbi:MAG: MoaD/ThiS family protein [Filomicrobium sp.]